MNFDAAVQKLQEAEARNAHTSVQLLVPPPMSFYEHQRTTDPHYAFHTRGRTDLNAQEGDVWILVNARDGRVESIRTPTWRSWTGDIGSRNATVKA